MREKEKFFCESLIIKDKAIKELIQMIRHDLIFFHCRSFFLSFTLGERERKTITGNVLPTVHKFILQALLMRSFIDPKVIT